MAFCKLPACRAFDETPFRHVEMVFGLVRFKMPESKAVMSGYYVPYGNAKGLKPYSRNTDFKPLILMLLSRSFISRVSFR